MAYILARSVSFEIVENLPLRYCMLILGTTDQQLTTLLLKIFCYRRIQRQLWKMSLEFINFAETRLRFVEKQFFIQKFRFFRTWKFFYNLLVQQNK